MAQLKLQELVGTRDVMLTRMRPHRNLGPAASHHFTCDVGGEPIVFAPSADLTVAFGEPYLMVRPADDAAPDSRNSEWLNICANCATKPENAWLIAKARVRTSRPLFGWDNLWAYHAFKGRLQDTGTLADAIKAELEGGVAHDDGTLLYRVPMSHLDEHGEVLPEVWAPLTVSDDDRESIFASIDDNERKRSAVIRAAYWEANPPRDTHPEVSEAPEPRRRQGSAGSLRDRSKDGPEVAIWQPGKAKAKKL